jgi:hypothetical protein
MLKESKEYNEELDYGDAGLEFDEYGSGLAVGSFGRPGDSIHWADSDGVGDDILKDLDSMLDGPGGQQLLMGMVADQEDLGVAPRLLEELDEAARRRISIARKREGKTKLKGVSEEDFDEGPERSAFIVVKSYRNDLFSANDTARWQAMRFFFCSQDDGGLNFDLACRVLNARIDIIRLRIQYELFLRWWIAPVAFPFSCVEAPEDIDNECAYVCGILGRDLAYAAWCQPGASSTILAKSVNAPTDAVIQALEKLDDKMLLCCQGEDNWYLTGRNPYLLRKRLAEKQGVSLNTLGGSIYWSRLF